MGADIAETFAPAWRPHLKDWAVEVERMGHIQFRAQMLRKGGEVFPVEVDLVALPGEDGRMDLGVATVQDITAQLAGEKELQDAAAMLRSIMDSISPMLAVVDGQGAIIHSNEAWKRFCPSPSGSVLGMGANLLQRLEETLPEGEGAGITQSLRRLAETEDGHFETEFAWESRWLHMGATGLRGSLKGLVIILTDITARRHSDSALKASEERFFAIFQASPIATLLTDSAEETILDANPAFLRLSGHALKDALGHSTLELGFWMDSEVRRNAMDRIQAEGRLRNFEMSFRLASGEAGQAVVSAETAHLGGRPVTVSLFRDVTDMRSAQEKERQMERELSHLQRLESVGRLAGGVSHDMNNVLCAIMTMAELMKRDCAHSPELTRKTDLIAQAATRGRDLVKSLTDFARKEVKDAIPLDLNQLVEREAELLEHTTFKRVEIRLNLTHPLPEVLGEASALANVLMNLCVNACDAMPSGGVLSLETRHPRPDWVELIVEDTGSGMSPEVINRAMEPFFTTKPSGKGTGLGLSIVYGTVKAHGGSVEIKSAPGKGTRITLGFPTQTAPLQAPAFPWETAPGPSISMRILVVDDDELVRNTLSPLLEMLGHHVESASSGLEALRRLESGLQVERVILDLNMPGLSGLETLSRLRILQPELPVMVSTGFVDAEVEEVLRTFPNTKLLHKPFLISEFQRLLQS